MFWISARRKLYINIYLHLALKCLANKLICHVFFQISLYWFSPIQA